MKEMYIAPELELLSLAPAELLANNEQEVEFNALFANGEQNQASYIPEIDIEVGLQ